MVSYRAMSDDADTISKEIKTKKPGALNIAIYDSQVVRDWRFYKAVNPTFQGQINDLTNHNCGGDGVPHGFVFTPGTLQTDS